jgi:hypothetical protein
MLGQIIKAGLLVLPVQRFGLARTQSILALALIRQGMNSNPTEFVIGELHDPRPQRNQLPHFARQFDVNLLREVAFPSFGRSPYDRQCPLFSDQAEHERVMGSRGRQCFHRYTSTKGTWHRLSDSALVIGSKKVFQATALLRSHRSNCLT